MQFRKDVLDRFWSKVDIRDEDECWLWRAGKDKDGYGQFSISHTVNKRAHRIAYELTYGAIKDGEKVCHTCDNPPCCNPKHLFAGTQATNIADRVHKGRTARNRGEKCGRAKLTEADVREIRALRKTGLSLRSIARLFPVHNVTIGCIVRNETWRNTL